MSVMACYEGEATVYNLGSVEWIPPGEGRTFQVSERPVAVFRTRDGKVWATQALCPHRFGLLADGLTGSGYVVCPLHSYKFSMVTGEPVGHGCDALKTYPVSISETGDILLVLDDELEEAALYGQAERGTCSAFRSANE
ncbi:MAG TPA: Rieske 2Fe-2S domain-containing protein [Blastocatellia bacterium]|nr:Rieske 2Fe-2S domain-containing protein [Blastocatellia bacterium]